MRLLVVLAATAIALTSEAAQAYQKCGGSPAVDVYWERSVISVNGTFFQMKSEKLGKKTSRLVGHDMVFVHSKGGNTLIRHGGSTHHSCQKADGDLQNASIVPYSANKIVKSSAPADFGDDNGSGVQSASGDAVATAGDAAGVVVAAMVATGSQRHISRTAPWQSD